MSFSVTVFPPGDGRQAIALAQQAEGLGFDTFWVPDSHMIWGDPYVLLGAVASRTDRIRIGPCVTHPVVRHLSVTASALATLGNLAPGRLRVGLGVGSSGPATVGMRRVGARELEQALILLRELIGGRKVQLDGRDMQLTFSAGIEPPLYIGALSDHSLRAAGRSADGAIFSGPLNALGYCRAALGEGKPILWIVPMAIDPERERAREAVRAIVARTALVWLTRADRLGTIADEDREPLVRLQRDYDPYKHMTAAYSHLVEERWIDQWALAGTAEEVAAGCRRAFENGATEIIVNLQLPDASEQMRRFGPILSS
jgi:alkanesulfonate monooxygenase SsuD/methylene tetrahydromethanopterin reductase-like flavin-dependent oxidoreductase (luciferase family)